MTTRERVLAVLNKEEPDVVPWMGDLAYFRHYLDYSNNMPDEYAGEAGLLKMHRDLGVGFYLQGYFPTIEHHDGIEVSIEKNGMQTKTTFSTPVGDLTEIGEYVPSTFSTAPIKHLIESWRDLASLRYLFEHTHYEANYALANERVQEVGDDGFVLCYTPKSPIMDLVALKAGILNFTYMLMDAKDEVEETMHVMSKKFGEAARLAVDSPAEFIMIPENLSSEVIGKAYYEKYALPYHQQWTDEIRKAGKKSFIHLDGTVKGLIKEVSNAGFDVIEALTPKPAGDITMWEMDELADESVTLWGGLPGALFFDAVSDKEFEAFVIDTLEKMKKRPRFVLGVADQVPPYTSFERLKKVNELVEKYGVW